MRMFIVMVSLLFAACSPAIVQLPVEPVPELPFDCRYPEERPEVGESMVLINEQTVPVEEILRPDLHGARSCTLQKDGKVTTMTIDQNYVNYLLRYTREGEHLPGECPDGTLIVNEVRVYGFLGFSPSAGMKIYVHDTDTVRMLRSKAEFDERLRAPWPQD